jgi:hypothetical protein
VTVYRIGRGATRFDLIDLVEMAPVSTRPTTWGRIKAIYGRP